MNLFINKKMRCGVLVVMSVLLAVVLMSCPEAAAGDGSSDSGPVDSPVTSVTLHFTNDYKLEDKLKISFPAGTVSNSFTENGDILSVPQSDVSYSRSGNTHNVILKVRPYYGSDNLTNVANGTGTVKVTPELASSASSSIPANNELAIANNVISFTGTHEGATHTYTITLERQTNKVTVNILNAGINTMYASITSNAVNHFVNVFVHDSATEVAYATALTYTLRKTFILKQGITQNIYMDFIGKENYNINTSPTSIQTLPAFIMRPNTTYYLHVYYKDVHTGAERKDGIYPFKTEALPTAHTTGNTPKDFANTWAVANGGYKLSHYISGGTTAAAYAFAPTFLVSGKLFHRTAPDIADYTTPYNTIGALKYNFTNPMIISLVTTVKTLTDHEVFRNNASSSLGTVSTPNAGTKLFDFESTGTQAFHTTVTDGHLVYFYYGIDNFSKTAHEGDWSGKVGNTNTIEVFGFPLNPDIHNALWAITSKTDTTPVRPIK